MSRLESLVCALVAILFVGSLTGAARAQIHGFVEPCRVHFVQDNQTVCEACQPSPGDPKHCEKQLAPRGFVFKCRSTPGHSEPSEVWCAAKDRGSNTTKQYIVAGVALGVLGVVVVLTRRRRKKRTAEKSRK